MAEAAQQDQEVVAAAQQYLEAMPIPTLYDDALESIAERMPEEQREGFLRYMGDNIDSQVLYDNVHSALVAHFTAEELIALTRFYTSPEGRAIRAKMGKYTAMVMPGVQAEISRVYRDYKAQR